MKSIYRLTVCAAIAAAFACAVPAHAGSWQLTSSYSGGGNAGSWGGSWVNSSTSTSYSFGAVYDNGSGGETGSYTYSGSIQWVGGGTQPSSVTLTETASSDADALYTVTATQTANDGFGDPAITTEGTGPRDSVDTNSSGTHTTVVPMAPGEVYTFTRTLSASSYGGAVNDCSANYSISIQ